MKIKIYREKKILHCTVELSQVDVNVIETELDDKLFLDGGPFVLLHNLSHYTRILEVKEIPISVTNLLRAH